MVAAMLVAIVAMAVIVIVPVAIAIAVVVLADDAVVAAIRRNDAAGG
jgi:hypothetical protein